MSKVWTNEVETFVARDKDHLQEVYRDFYGCSMEDMTGDPMEITMWEAYKDDEPVTLYYEGDIVIDETWIPPTAEIEEVPEQERFNEWTHKATAKASDWAAANPEGCFLGSTEW